jgi:hypothetical protein
VFSLPYLLASVEGWRIVLHPFTLLSRISVPSGSSGLTGSFLEIPTGAAFDTIIPKIESAVYQVLALLNRFLLFFRKEGGR